MGYNVFSSSFSNSSLREDHGSVTVEVGHLFHNCQTLPSHYPWRTHTNITQILLFFRREKFKSEVWMEINCWTIEGRRRVGAGGNRTSTALDACLIICFFYGGWGEEKEKENLTSFPTRGPESWYIPSIGSWILIHIHFSSEIPWLLDIILFNFWSYKTGHLILYSECCVWMVHEPLDGGYEAVLRTNRRYFEILGITVVFTQCNDFFPIIISPNLKILRKKMGYEKWEIFKS